MSSRWNIRTTSTLSFCFTKSRYLQSLPVAPVMLLLHPAVFMILDIYHNQYFHTSLQPFERKLTGNIFPTSCFPSLLISTVSDFARCCNLVPSIHHRCKEQHEDNSTSQTWYLQHKYPSLTTRNNYFQFKTRPFHP